MSEEKLYRIEELSTNDWHLVNDRATNMTRQIPQDNNQQLSQVLLLPFHSQQ